MHKSLMIGLATLALLGGCSSLPQAVRLDNSQPNHTYLQALGDKNQSQWVSWQGQIAQVENQSDFTILQIVLLQLDQYGEPINDQTPGRFIAHIHGFLEPTIYRKGRTIAVKGTIQPKTTLKIGNASRTVPTINVTSYYLWPQQSDPVIQPIYLNSYPAWTSWH
ncbi:Slp family lipoprotein [Celerinatantimonas sp. YJH-8]|uniref:Slp family lipoprotein n=1 Tax=Celerinatantimonas sp. YJH-8 TaxID=3228714 RepID=UPI0038CB9DBC